MFDILPTLKGWELTRKIDKSPFLSSFDRRVTGRLGNTGGSEQARELDKNVQNGPGQGILLSDYVVQKNRVDEISYLARDQLQLIVRFEPKNGLKV